MSKRQRQVWGQWGRLLVLRGLLLDLRTRTSLTMRRIQREVKWKTHLKSVRNESGISPLSIRPVRSAKSWTCEWSFSSTSYGPLYPHIYRIHSIPTFEPRLRYSRKLSVKVGVAHCVYDANSHMYIERKLGSKRKISSHNPTFSPSWRSNWANTTIILSL